MKKTKVIIGILVIILIIAGIFASRLLGKNSGTYIAEDGSYEYITAEDSFAYVENHPAFSQFKDFIQPWKDRWNLFITPKLSVKTVCDLNHFNTESILDGFAYIIDMSKEQDIYFDYYSDEEKEADPTKEATGLLFLPGDPDKPVAVLNPGGAFKAVCWFAEGFPVARVLHEQGYPVFIVKYRVSPDAEDSMVTGGQELIADQDLGAAMQYIFAHQDDFGISMDDYSIWGFSAGGRLTSLFGLSNELGYAHYGVEKPAAFVQIYSGWYDEAYAPYYDSVPPSYFAWLDTDDVIGADNVKGIEAYMEALKERGIQVQDQVYHEAKHGFGEGRGTDAEGWYEKALDFWEEMR